METGFDVDLLVDFDGPTTFDDFMGLRAMLEDALAQVPGSEPRATTKPAPSASDGTTATARRAAAPPTTGSGDPSGRPSARPSRLAAPSDRRPPPRDRSSTRCLASPCDRAGSRPGLTSI